MTKLEKIILEHIVDDVVTQGYHKYKITEYFEILVKCAREEFTEDNKSSLDFFLQQCLTDVLNEV